MNEKRLLDLRRFRHARPGRSHQLVVGRATEYIIVDGERQLVKLNTSAVPLPIDETVHPVRLLIVDEDTGEMYAELQDRRAKLDLIGFLGRAWSSKSVSHLAGVPATLSYEYTLRQNEKLAAQLSLVLEAFSIDSVALPRSFCMKSLSLRAYEKVMASALWLKPIPLTQIQAGADILSAEAFKLVFEGVSPSSFGSNEGHELTPDQVAAFDRMKSGLAWREGAYHFVRNDLAQAEIALSSLKPAQTVHGNA